MHLSRLVFNRIFFEMVSEEWFRTVTYSHILSLVDLLQSFEQQHENSLPYSCEGPREVEQDADAITEGIRDDAEFHSRYSFKDENPISRRKKNSAII